MYQSSCCVNAPTPSHPSPKRMLTAIRAATEVPAVCRPRSSWRKLGLLNMLRRVDMIIRG